jgi:sulfide:quinone oxidoreductase
MAAKILVLGDGVGGLVTANLLVKRARRLGMALQVQLIGNSPVHTYQPGLLFIPFQKAGYKTLANIQKQTARFIGPGIEYLVRRITSIDPAIRTVRAEGEDFSYDWLVLALGARTLVDEVDGLREQWGTRAHGFYTPESAVRLAQALAAFDGGDLVVDVAEMPIKCPVAPLEFAMLADEYLTRRGIRSRSRVTVVTPLNGAFTKPVCNDMLSDLLVDKGLELVSNAPLASVTDKSITCPDGKSVPYDLLVTIPPHEGSDLIEDAGLGDGLGFGATDKHTLKSQIAERVFLVGDNTNVPTSKAGSVTHFQADVVVHNLLREIRGEEAQPLADGHANCFIETGSGRAILIDFNYDVQPVPGDFPIPGVGPLSLLKETRINHLGKLAFRLAYWHVLLRGRHMPFVRSQMNTSGKNLGMLERYTQAGE